MMKPEEELRPKIQSKMQVATFLAGFTFTALMANLTKGGLPNFECLGKPQIQLDCIYALSPWLGTISLTAAMALFIASVYILDILLMPERFWDRGRQIFWQNLPKVVQDNKNHGVVYGYMEHVWRKVFTPGVVLAGIGFTVIFTGFGWQALVIWVSLVGAVLAYYGNVRPKLGVVD